MGTLNPLEIFPLEVWKMIFEQLSGQQGSSINLLNCSNVCTEFADVLKPTQFLWLFESVFPFIFPYLKGKEVLMCRTVCKEWCRVVDSFLENFDARLPFNEETTDISGSSMRKDCILKEKGLWTRFTNPEEISEFMKVMKNGKNPFIGSSLHLSEEYESEWPEDTFNEKASELLKMLGKHIKHISLNDPFIDTVEDVYHLLQKYLLSLPNLRSLKVDEEIVFSWSDDFREICRRLRELKEFLARESSSLPEISSLESIEMSTYGHPPSIYEKLIDGLNPSKLKCLKLNVKPVLMDDTVFILTLKQPLPSLTELHLWYIEKYEQLSHLLTNLVSKEAPLGKLVLYFWYPEYRVKVSKINFDLVFEAISRFGQTLKMLTIKGFQSHDEITELPNPSLSFLKVPHLRSLEIDGVAFGPRFLPSNLAQSLEYLHISLPHKLASGTEFYKGALGGNLCYSPIWSEMPKLKAIKVYLEFNNKTTTCTRVMYERGVRSAPLCIDEFISRVNELDASSESEFD